MLDTTTGLFWDQMTAAQRAASAVRFGRVVWEGANVSAGVPRVLFFGSPELKILSPALIAGPYQFGTAAFGPPIGSPGVTALFGRGGSIECCGPGTTDACTPVTNAASVAGKSRWSNAAPAHSGKGEECGECRRRGVIIYNNAANVDAAPPRNGGGSARRAR